MNKISLACIFFVIFLVFETLLYYIYKNGNTIKESFLQQHEENKKRTKTIEPTKKSNSNYTVKEPFLEAYQGSETNYEHCKKSGYPHRWCLHIQEPYSIPNPESLTECI